MSPLAMAIKLAREQSTPFPKSVTFSVLPRNR